jgi:hypothetical protein
LWLVAVAVLLAFLIIWALAVLVALLTTHFIFSQELTPVPLVLVGQHWLIITQGRPVTMAIIRFSQLSPQTVGGAVELMGLPVALVSLVDLLVALETVTLPLWHQTARVRGAEVVVVRQTVPAVGAVPPRAVTLLTRLGSRLAVTEDKQT